MKFIAQNLIPNFRSGHQLIQRPSRQKLIRSSAAKIKARAMKALQLIAILIVGCGMDPEYVTRQAATLSDGRLMDKWHSKIEMKRNSMMQTVVMHEEVVRNEALKRGIVRPSMVKNIHDGMATIGMTRLEAVAAWGSPRDINTTTTARGRHEQWCYGGVTGSGNVLPMSFLYFENGILTTIQN
jgi:hypothetical protein